MMTGNAWNRMAGKWVDIHRLSRHGFHTKKRSQVDERLSIWLVRGEDILSGTCAGAFCFRKASGHTLCHLRSWRQQSQTHHEPSGGAWSDVSRWYTVMSRLNRLAPNAYHTKCTSTSYFRYQAESSLVQRLLVNSLVAMRIMLYYQQGIRTLIGKASCHYNFLSTSSVR